MKIFNISDVETKLLKQRNLVNHTVVVGKQLLSPGSSADVPDDVVQMKLECIDQLVEVGVLARGATPKGYTPAPKQAAPVPQGDSPAPAKSVAPKAPKKADKE